MSPPLAGISATDLRVVERHLAPGERIEWIGHPDPGKHFSRADLVLVPFSLMWGGFAIFWEVSVIAARGPFFFKLWGIPFVLIGLYLIVGRFFYQAYRDRRTTYAVTNQRVLSLVARSRSETVDAIYLPAIPGISVTAGRKGDGTVQFGLSTGSARFANAGWPSFGRSGADSGGVSFHGIRDAKSVAQLVERLRATDRK